uniref:Uncharacterized protein n=1 Tax=Myotis myotis TaxID=51298 RepID=A0A7J7SS30_MYOMY|nr:hypothetical protein mMyoMyo1_009415 [Myotis myotis]
MVPGQQRGGGPSTRSSRWGLRCPRPGLGGGRCSCILPGRAMPRSEPFMPPLGLSIALSSPLPAPSWSRVVASAFSSSPRAHLSTAQFGWFGAQLQSTSPPLTWDPTFSLVAASPWNGVPGVQGPCPGSLAPGKGIIPLPFWAATPPL